MYAQAQVPDAPCQSLSVVVDDRPPSISLVLPAWNEAEGILAAIAEADAALRNLTDDYEIIVVDDGSSDGTAERVQAALPAVASLRLISHRRNEGYGAALRTGFRAATKSLIAFTDADRQFDLTELDRLMLLSKRYDIVCGYRIDRQDSALRCFYSRVYNQIVRVLLGTGVRDVDCAMKMFRRDVIDKLEISTDGFLVNAALLSEARRQHHTVVEVGVSHRPRTLGKSSVSIKHIPLVICSLMQYWWNAVLFAGCTGQCDGGRGPGEARSRRRQWLPYGLLVAAAIFLFANLDYPLIDRDETRYAEIPREMLVSGEWILPQLNFETYYDKPPLTYWLCAGSYLLFGVSERSARLVPALAALITLAVTMWFGRRHFGARNGLISGVVLMLSAGFAFTSRYLLIDGVLSCLVTLSLVTAYEAIRSPQVGLRWWLLSAFFCGLGFLSKGPVSLVLLLPPLIAFTWLAKPPGRPGGWHYAGTVTVVALMACPWIVAVSLKQASFVPEFLYQHNLQRFAGQFHARPVWFFLPVLLIAGHPWSFLAIPLARFLCSGEARYRLRRPPVLGFLILWAGWCFLFFSLSRCKLPTYLLPAGPALALIVGHYLNFLIEERPTASLDRFAWVWSARAASVTTCLAGLGLLGYAAIAGVEISSATYAWVLLWAVLLAGMLWNLRDSHPAPAGWGRATLMAFLLAVMVMHGVVPAYSRRQTILGPSSAAALRSSLSEGVPVATINHEFSEVPFYLNRSDIPNFAAGDAGQLRAFAADHSEAVLIVDREMPLTELCQQLPSGSKLQLLTDRGPARLLRLSKYGSGNGVPLGDAFQTTSTW